MCSVNLLENERDCLRAMKRIGKPTTWEAVQREACMPCIRVDVFMRGGYIENVGRSECGRSFQYTLTAKGMEAASE
jgi:hypothetical protein